MDFTPSQRGTDYLTRVVGFIREHVAPAETGYLAELRAREDRWVVLPVVDELKARAREQGLWNLFLPDATHGAGLSNTEYAPLAEAMGHSFLAPEVFNCNAPDTGNMEVLLRYGSAEQRERWLAPLLGGEMRSAFCMTEPDVASSDATNIAATARLEGDEVVLRGRKWWCTGVGHPRCRLLIFMGLTDPDAPRHRRHSMVIVPRDAPGVRVERMLTALGDLDEPYGHGEVSFDDVRVPAGNVIAGPGRGFEIAQGRLGPGRVHHCMRAIGAAERALELLVRRALSRRAFGKTLAELGANADVIAEARIAIEQARLLTLKTAWALDHHGIAGAMSEVSQIKVVVPRMLQTVVDQAIQIHGGAGVGPDVPLTALFAYARCLRIADGPDEVHRRLVARAELARYRDAKRD